MKERTRLLLNILKDPKGNISSKRYGFILSLYSWLAMSWGVVFYLMIKEQYQFIVDILQSIALATFGFSGVVASEFFGKNKKDKEDQNDTKL